MLHSELNTQLSGRFPRLKQKDAEWAATETLGTIHMWLIRGDRVSL